MKKAFDSIYIVSFGINSSDLAWIENWLEFENFNAYDQASICISIHCKSSADISVTQGVKVQPLLALFSLRINFNCIAKTWPKIKHPKSKCFSHIYVRLLQWQMWWELSITCTNLKTKKHTGLWFDIYTHLLPVELIKSKPGKIEFSIINTCNVLQRSTRLQLPLYLSIWNLLKIIKTYFHWEHCYIPQ